MAESKQTLLDALNQLSEKMDSYDQRLTTLGSDLSKVQSQVDLSLRSIQVLQKEQVLLLKSVHPAGGGGSLGATNSNSVIGASPTLPISTTPPLQQQSLLGDVHIPTHPANPLAHESYENLHAADPKRHWMHKMDFPHFDGSDVRIWLDKCTTYFQLYFIPLDFRVTVASLHMVDRASHWFQSYKHSGGVHTWEHFVVGVSKEFEVNAHRVKTIALLNLRQTCFVQDYKQQFDQLIYHIRLYDHSISGTMLTSQFLLGLLLYRSTSVTNPSYIRGSIILQKLRLRILGSI
jgi:hypothetical protein